MKEETYRAMMMVLMVIGIVLFLIAIIALSKNVNEIKNDPILYGMDKHGFSSCSCLSDQGMITISLDDYKKEG